jgi:uncharacterized protein
MADFFDLKIPVTNKIIIYFNKSYNPYCAYNICYSCPVLPDENLLPLRIKAGVIFEEKLFSSCF